MEKENRTMQDAPYSDRLFGFLVDGIVPAQEVIHTGLEPTWPADVTRLRLARMAWRCLLMLARARVLDPHRVRLAMADAAKYFATLPSTGRWRAKVQRAHRTTQWVNLHISTATIGRVLAGELVGGQEAD